MPKYEPAAQCEMMLCSGAAILALDGCGWRPPTLFVHPDRTGTAREIAMEVGMNVEVDESLCITEWYVEWHGNRRGSLGA